MSIKEKFNQTHKICAITGIFIQIVSRHQLRTILQSQGKSLEKPAEFSASDEWDV